MNFSSIATMQPHLNAGRVRAIAVTTRARSQFQPDVPTFIESGYNVEVNAWYGLLTTGKTPPPVVERLSKELQQILAEQPVRAALLKHGLDPQPTRADEFRALIAAEIAKWSKVVREAGIPQE